MSSATTSTYTLSKCTDADEFHRRFTDLQPASSEAIGTALDGGLNKRTSRGHLVHDQNGNLAGGLVVHRWALNRWTALPVLIDLGAAAIVGAHIDGGPADGVHCPASVANALLPHLSRHRSTIHEITASLPWPIVWDEPDPHCRVAEPDDEDALVELYWRSQLNFMTSRRALRSFIRKSPHEILVYDPGDGRGIIGMGTVLTRTPEYDVAGDAVVDPGERNQGVAWALAGFGIHRANERGVGGQVFVRESNPMSVPVDTLAPDDFVHLTLRAPRRFRGEPRLHRWWYRLAARDKSRESAQRFTHDRVDRRRRTQAAWKDRLQSDDQE